MGKEGRPEDPTESMVILTEIGTGDVNAKTYYFDRREGIALGKRNKIYQPGHGWTA